MVAAGRFPAGHPGTRYSPSVPDDARLALKILPGAKDDPDFTYTGPAGFIQVAEQARARFDKYKVSITFGQFVASDDAVMAGVKLTGKDRATGKELKKRLAHMWKLLDGQIVHGQVFDRTGDAFKAAGFGTQLKPPRNGLFGDSTNSLVAVRQFTGPVP